MSLIAENTWAASPTTARGQPTILSSDPKGERIAYASNKSIYLRSIDNPSLSKQYNQHKAATTVARFSPSGFKVASGDESGVVHVWDALAEEQWDQGGERGKFGIIAGRINDIAWDGDSQRIIAVGDGQKGRQGHCITADSGNSVGEISGHSGLINSVSIRQQRPLRAATGSDDTSVVFYHGAPFKFNAKLQGHHQRFVFGTAFAPNGEVFASVGADKKIWLYDGKTGEAKGQIGEGVHSGSIFGVSWSKDSQKFATASADQTVKVWDVEAGKAIQSWRLGEEDSVSIPDQQMGVVWPSGRSDGLIISVDLDGNLNYFAEGHASPVKTVYGHQRNITSAAISGKTFVTGSYEGRVRAWDIASGTASLLDGESHSNYVSGVAASDSEIQTVGWDDTLRSISLSAGTFNGSVGSIQGQPKAVAISSKTTLVATPESIQLFTSGKPSGTLSTKYTATCIAASGPLIAVGGSDKLVHIYTLDSPSALTDKSIALSKATSEISTLAFSPSGTYLAVGTTAGKIIVWNVPSSSSSAADWTIATDRWSAHTARVTSIAWDEKSERAVSGSLDTNVHLWSLKEPGKRVKVGNAHKDGVNGVAWVDGTKVLSAGADASVKVWSVK